MRSTLVLPWLVLAACGDLDPLDPSTAKLI